MTEETNNNLLNSLDEVLKFSSELIMLSLQERKPSDSEIKRVRKCCETLRQANMYEFNINCSDEDLFRQVQSFAQNING